MGATSHAQQADVTFERLSLGEGFSGYVIRALERDSRGFLWVGTQRGLDRYDGVRVRAFTAGPEGAQLRGGLIRAIEEDPTTPGGLWVGTEGGGLSRYHPIRGGFATYTRATSALTSDTIRCLLVDSRGTVWAGTASGGLNRYREREGAFEALRSGPGGSVPSDTITALYEAPSMPGVIWVGTPRGVALLDAESGRPLADIGGEAVRGPPQLAVTAVAEAGGAVWIGTTSGVLFRYDFLQNEIYSYSNSAFGPGLGSISALVPSRVFPGRLWIGTRAGGLLAFDTRTDAVRSFTSESGGSASLSHNDVLTVLEDGSGLLWVGTLLGLNKANLNPPRFMPRAAGPTAAVSEPANAVITLYEPPSNPGTVWLSLARAGLQRYDRVSGRLEPFALPTNPLDLVFSLHEDRYGQFWAGADRPSLFLIDQRNGRATAFPLQEGPGGGRLDVQVIQIYEAPSRPGNLWLATRGLGLVEFDARRRRVVRRYAPGGAAGRSLSTADLWAVHEPTHEPGVLWIGTQGGGVNRLDTRTGTVTVWTSQSHPGCLPSDDILAVNTTSDGTIWLGTSDHGLVRFSPHDASCVTYTPADGLAHTDVAAILVDGRDRLWLSTSNGLSLLDPARGAITTFSEADGLQGNIFHYQSHHQNTKGELFFGGADGFNIFHPDSITVDATPPPVFITGLYVDGQPVPLEEGARGYTPITLRHTQRDVAIEFAALDLRQPHKNRYRVWMEGAEVGWRPLGTQPHERYPLMPFGRHTLHVLGSNRDGAWSAGAATLQLRILPPLWKTWYFWGLVAALAIGLVAAAYQYRIRQLVRVELTRRRIADDLHDDIGSKVSNVALRLDLAGRSAALPEEERRHLVELAQMARGVVDDLRDAVWIVDAGHDDLPSVAARMEQFAEQMLRGRAYTFSRPDELPPLPLGMEGRRHLYLLYKEALHNAVRHGDPSRITVRLEVEGGRLVLVVADDGRGFTCGDSGKGRGLETMRARAEALGGALRVASAPGQGTTVELVIEIP